MPAHRKDFQGAVDLYNSGHSIEECAMHYGISRQAMHFILKRRGVQFRPQRKYGPDNHFFVDGTEYTAEQIRVGKRTMKAIKNGKLIPQPCEKCGFTGKASDGRNLVQAHHDDYSKPLEVRWLCIDCHYEEHHADTSAGNVEPEREGEGTVRADAEVPSESNRQTSIDLI